MEGSRFLWEIDQKERRGLLGLNGVCFITWTGAFVVRGEAEVFEALAVWFRDGKKAIYSFQDGTSTAL